MIILTMRPHKYALLCGCTAILLTCLARMEGILRAITRVAIMRFQYIFE